MFLSMSLNSKTNVAKTNAGLYKPNSFIHTFLGNLDQSVCEWFDFPNFEHLTGVAVVAGFDHGDIYVDNVATL